MSSASCYSTQMHIDKISLWVQTSDQGILAMGYEVQGQMLQKECDQSWLQGHGQTSSI